MAKERSHEKDKMIYVISHQKNRTVKRRSIEKDKLGYVKSHVTERMAKGRSQRDGQDALLN